MRSVGFAFAWVLNVLLAAGATLGCCGRSQSQAGNSVDVMSTGGQPATGGASTGGGAKDAGDALDAGVCNAAVAQAWLDKSIVCLSSCCSTGGNCGSDELNTATLVDCAMQLHGSPPDLHNVIVVVNCSMKPPLSNWSLDAGALGDATGWYIDYSFEPAHLVFGAQLCDEVKTLGNVSVAVILGCDLIC